MARLPSRAPVEVEPTVPAWAEEWFDAADARDAFLAGHRDQTLLDHLSTLAGERYAAAEISRIRQRVGLTRMSGRNCVVQIRPKVRTGRHDIDAHRHWLLSRKCPFRDSEAFLAAVRG